MDDRFLNNYEWFQKVQVELDEMSIKYNQNRLFVVSQLQARIAMQKKWVLQKVGELMDRSKNYLIAAFSHEKNDPWEVKKGKALDTLFDRANISNGLFLYDDDIGGRNFLDVAHSEVWYNEIARAELMLYASQCDPLLAEFADEKLQSIILYGSGDATKETQICTLIDPSLQILQWKTIYPIDICQSSLDVAKKTVAVACKARYVSSHVVPLKDDYVSASRLRKLNPPGRIYLCAGWVFSNMTHEEIVETIKNMEPHEDQEECTIIVSVFLASEVNPLHALCYKGSAEEAKQSDLQWLIHSYSDKNIQAWVMQWLSKIGIDTACIEFHTTYKENEDDQWWSVLVGVQVTKDFSLEHEGKTYSRMRGEKICAIPSHRFDIVTLSALVEQGGGEIVNIIAPPFIAFHNSFASHCVVIHKKRKHTD